MRVKVHVIASYVIASTASEYPLPNVKYDLKMNVIVICHRSDFHAIHRSSKGNTFARCLLCSSDFSVIIDSRDTCMYMCTQ